MPPRKRRQYGTGSITRRPDGTWLGRIELTPSRQGQARRRKSFVSNNIVITCWDCNAAKGTMTEPEFRAWAAKGKFFTRERKPQQRDPVGATEAAMRMGTRSQPAPDQRQTEREPQQRLGHVVGTQADRPGHGGRHQQETSGRHGKVAAGVPTQRRPGRIGNLWPCGAH